MKKRKVLPGLAMALVILLSYTLLAIEGPQVCQFDYNGDGDVDGQDLAQFISEFDAQDLDLIAGEFGQSNCAVFALYPEDVDYGLATDEQQGGGGLVGDTVRILNGNTIEYRKDLSFASPHSFGLSFSATFNSQSSTLSALGFGWTHTYNLSLIADFYFSGKSYLKIWMGPAAVFISSKRPPICTGVLFLKKNMLPWKPQIMSGTDWTAANMVFQKAGG